MAVIKKKRKPVEIPTASMADISFLLLLFFMVCTVFVRYKGLKVSMPKAKSIDKITRSNATTIYVDKRGNISIDDMPLSILQVKDMMLRKKAENFNLISCFRTDENTTYGIMSDILNQLRDADALKVNFEAKMKR